MTANPALGQVPRAWLGGPEWALHEIIHISWSRVQWLAFNRRSITVSTFDCSHLKVLYCSTLGPRDSCWVWQEERITFLRRMANRITPSYVVKGLMKCPLEDVSCYLSWPGSCALCQNIQKPLMQCLCFYLAEASGFSPECIKEKHNFLFVCLFVLLPKHLAAVFFEQNR